jgi:3-phosphoglycerate kinase
MPSNSAVLDVSSPRNLLDFKRVTENDKVSAVIGGSRFRQTSSHQGTSQTVDTLVLGGELAFTFLKALGILGSSLVEGRDGEGALEEAERTGKTIVLPCRCRLFKRSQMEKEDTKTFDLLTAIQASKMAGWAWTLDRNLFNSFHEV